MGLIQREVQKVYMWKEPYTDYSAMQGPCSSGYHIPSKDEWQTIFNTGVSLGVWTTSNGTAFKRYLKIPMAGYRDRLSDLQGQGSYGMYWSRNIYDNDHSYSLELSSGTIRPADYSYYKSCGFSIRAFKDTSVSPDSSRTVLYQGTGSAGIYHNATLGLISISSDGSTRYTMQDKNLGATEVYEYTVQTLTEANCGKFYQWGNNYGFSRSGSITTSSTLVDASSYGPGNFYNSSTFITTGYNGWDTSNNKDLRGGETGVITGGGDIQIRPVSKPRTPNEHTYARRPLTVDTTVNDMSGNGRTLSGSGGTYSTTAGVSSLYMGTASQYRVYSSFPNTTRENTFLVRVYISNKSYARTLLNYSSTSQTISLSTTPQIYYQYKTGASSSTSKGVNVPDSLGIWTLVAITHSSNNATRTVYRINENETQKIEITNGYTGGLGTTWYIGNTDSANAGWRQGALSNIIVEDYAWTEEEILNHYNTSKANYGIS